MYFTEVTPLHLLHQMCGFFCLCFYLNGSLSLLEDHVHNPFNAGVDEEMSGTFSQRQIHLEHRAQPRLGESDWDC